MQPAGARFRHRTIHEPNLIHRNKYIKSSASESIRNTWFNLERLSRPSRFARTGNSTLDELWNGFDSDTDLFMYRTKSISYYNVFCKNKDLRLNQFSRSK